MTSKNYFSFSIGDNSEDALEDSIGTFDEDEPQQPREGKKKKRPPKIWISKSASMEHDLD